MNEQINVLYVEDDDLTRESFYGILKKRYFSNVFCASNGTEGLRLYKENAGDIDLVISDIAMPDLNGVDMVEKLKKINPDLCVILTSGQDSKSELIKAIELGVNRFILKPIDYYDLDKSLMSVIRHIEAMNRLEELKKEASVSQQLMYEYKKAVDESTIFSIADLKGNIKYANKQFREVSGYTLEELQGRPHSIVRHPDMPKEAFKQMWETIQNKQVWHGTVKNRKKNGDPYYVKATIVPIVDQNGEIFEYAGIRDDISELVKKERELEDFKDKQRFQDVNKALRLKEEEILKSIPFASLYVAKEDGSARANDIFSENFGSKGITAENFFSSLESGDAYIEANDIFEFYSRCRLSLDAPVIAVRDFDEVETYKVGVTEKENGYIVTLVEAG
jgi:PAS domain S-box-containing protein